MEFLLSREDLDVVELAREAIGAHVPLSRVRESEEWRGWVALGSAGWLHACLSGEVSMPVLSAIAREAGRVAGSGQFVSNAWTIPKLLSSAADEDAGAAWLDHHGSRPGALLHAGMGERSVLAGLGPGYDLYLVQASGAAPTLHRCDHGTVLSSPVAGLSLGAARLDELPAPDATLPLALTSEQAQAITRGARVLAAGAAAGLADELVARTVSHVTSREQFGQPLGRFQAVKHLLADAHAGAEVAWLSVLFAAADGDDAAADHAELLSRRALTFAAQTSSQLQGAMGFTWESDLHLLLKAGLDIRATTQDPTVVAQRSGLATMATVPTMGE
ncbi:acyl-CoA dehydrogenase family protein [Nocardioides humi]|uniref:Acyl-CoA dehydrogenase/oxidase C-terminal domain-containing protein n=1 Tax=Nocardioides humi TaxID=449461 RepID=A0ABN2B4N2_9ACTN|nr:acyl-CoA dehydrogenase family protein [Nocardioides humi]